MTRAFKLADKVSDLRDDIESKASDGLDDGMEEASSEVRRQIDENDSIASGRLLSESKSGAGPHDSPTTIASRRIAVPWWYRYVEYGTGAVGGSTPWPDDEQYPSPSPIANVEHIQRYIDMKGIEGRFYDAARRANGDPGPLAWAMARTIAAIGNRPHPFMRPAWYGSTRGRDGVISSVESRVNTAIRRF